MSISARARSATDLPFRFTWPYSVTTYITSVRGVVTMLPGVSVATMRLCRCGNSSNKPFCDSTHVRVGWTDEKGPDGVPDRLDTYAAPQVTIRDNRGICSHAGYCTGGLPAVFRSGAEPWIDASAAPADEIVRTIRRCPSGALAYEREGRIETDFGGEASIEVSRNGPYRVRGSVELRGVEFGEGASREHFTLCRCGHSRNKPSAMAATGTQASRMTRR